MDSHGTGGLIGYGNQSSVVTFDVPCTEYLNIQYLASYERMGAVKVYFGDDETGYTIIDGLWKDKTSMSAYKRINIPKIENEKEDVKVTFEILSKNTEKSYTEIDQNSEKVRMDRKFNLIELGCCHNK